MLLGAVAIGKQRDKLDDDALKRRAADLRRRLNRLLAAAPIGQPGCRLHKRMARNRDHLFVFVTNRMVPYTNNVSERNLRPSVIFRKVTNGFRCEWGADTYTAFRSVASTAKANPTTALDALLAALLTKAQSAPG